MRIQEVIVVEGKNDTNNLHKYFDCTTIETNGLNLTKQTLDYIKQINKTRGIILLLDPDSPGEKIRNKINQYIPNLKNAFVDKSDAKTNKKVGIEHASKQTLEKALSNLITYSTANNAITLNDLIDLKLMGDKNSNIIREKISKKLSIGKCNAKTFLKRINMLNIELKDLKDYL